MSLRVTKPGFTPTTRTPKLNPVNGKVRGHLDRRRQGKWETTSSQCWFVSLIRRELFTKNLFLLVKQLMLHSTSKFWNVHGRMCEGSDLISGGTTHGCSTMTMRQPMVPSWLDGFWQITWLWCHILPTRPTLRPATFSYFQNWKWSLRGEDFRRRRKFKQSRRPSWTRYRKWLPRIFQKLAAPLGSLSSLRRGLLWRWCRPLMSKVKPFCVLSHQSGNLLTTPRNNTIISEGSRPLPVSKYSSLTCKFLMNFVEKK